YAASVAANGSLVFALARSSLLIVVVPSSGETPVRLLLLTVVEPDGSGPSPQALRIAIAPKISREPSRKAGRRRVTHLGRRTWVNCLYQGMGCSSLKARWRRK